MAEGTCIGVRTALCCLVVAAAVLVGIGVGYGIQERTGEIQSEITTSITPIITITIPITPTMEAATWWVMSRSIGVRLAQTKVPMLLGGGQEQRNDLVSSRKLPTPQREWESLICAEPFTLWSCTWALATIHCESGSNANAVGGGWYEGQYWYYYGLWQIASLVKPGGRMDWLFDPYLNTLEANIKYASGGRTHWPGCGYLIPTSS